MRYMAENVVGGLMVEMTAEIEVGGLMAEMKVDVDVKVEAQVHEQVREHALVDVLERRAVGDVGRQPAVVVAVRDAAARHVGEVAQRHDHVRDARAGEPAPRLLRRGEVRRNDLHPRQSHDMAQLVAVRRFPMFGEPRWRRKVHVMTYALGG